MPSIVRAKRDESTDSVIKRFKKRMMIDNILTLVKEKEFYKKPALLRKDHNKEIERRKYRERMERQKSSKKSFKKSKKK
ncbi:MAG: 30S ribosomal protein S21 [Candidatus Pacebacteria bacterium]|nr:30S ribosomal protein S21 [Candidatus Paceibacterota bacterium]